VKVEEGELKISRKLGRMQTLGRMLLAEKPRSRLKYLLSIIKIWGFIISPPPSNIAGKGGEKSHDFFHE